MLSYYIFYNIIIGPDFLLGLFSYALGGSVGTVLTMRRKSIKSFFIKFLSEKYTAAEVEVNAEVGNRIPEEVDSY